MPSAAASACGGAAGSVLPASAAAGCVLAGSNGSFSAASLSCKRAQRPEHLARLDISTAEHSPCKELLLMLQLHSGPVLRRDAAHLSKFVQSHGRKVGAHHRCSNKRGVLRQGRTAGLSAAASEAEGASSSATSVTGPVMDPEPLPSWPASARRATVASCAKASSRSSLKIT